MAFFDKKEVNTPEVSEAADALDKEKVYYEKRMLAVQGKRKCEKCGKAELTLGGR